MALRTLLFSSILVELLLVGRAAGQTGPDSGRMVIELAITGEISAGQLREVMHFSRQHELPAARLQQTLRDILEALQARGYWFARIDSVRRTSGGSSASHRLVHASTGRRWRLQMTGAPPPISAVAQIWGESTSRKLDEASFMDETNRLLRACAQQGYPLAALSVDSVSLRMPAAVASLHLRVDPGPLVTIDSILVRGNRITRRAVLVRELPIKAGEVFRIDRVEEIPSRLLRLGFIRNASPPQLARDARGYHWLVVEVVEGGGNTLNGVAGYNPGTETTKGYLTGLIDLSFGNLFGTGRQLGARWEKRSRDTQELGLRYREPWIFGYPLNFAGAFQQLIQDTLYVERQVEVALEWPLSPRLSLTGRLSRQSVSPDSLASEQLSLPESRVLGAAFGLSYNSLDAPLNPRRGVVYQTSIESGRKRIASLGAIPASSTHRQRVIIDFQIVVPTWRSQVISLGAHGRQVMSGEEFVSITDEFRLGGATTLRGYREEQFRGSRVGWSNFEYRYLLGPRSRAFVFFDGGYAFKKTAAATTEEFKRAYGIGMRVETPLGVVGVDYGLGEGDGLLAGKVHVSVVNSF